MTTEGTKKMLDVKKKVELKTLVEKINDEFFNEFLEANDRDEEKFKNINDVLFYLQIDNTETETIENYKNIIQDKYKVLEHDNIISILKN